MSLKANITNVALAQDATDTGESFSRVQGLGRTFMFLPGMVEIDLDGLSGGRTAKVYITATSLCDKVVGSAATTHSNKLSSIIRSVVDSDLASIKPRNGMSFMACGRGEYITLYCSSSP